jgi:hypothetical protein
MTRNQDEQCIWLKPGLSMDDYTRWLRLGLAQYFREGKGPWALPGLAENYGRNFSIGEDIIDAVSKLPFADQEKFRDAVVDIARELDFNKQKNELLALLQIGLEFKSHELLEVIKSKIFTVHDLENQQSVLINCFEFARDIALYSGPKSISCLRHLTTQPTFPYQMSGQALEAMTAADPNGFVSHFKHLRDLLRKAFYEPTNDVEQFKRVTNRRKQLVKAIAKYGLDFEKLTAEIEAREGLSEFWWFDSVAAVFDHTPIAVSISNDFDFKGKLKSSLAITRTNRERLSSSDIDESELSEAWIDSVLGPTLDYQGGVGIAYVY